MHAEIRSRVIAAIPAAVCRTEARRQLGGRSRSDWASMFNVCESPLFASPFDDGFVFGVLCRVFDLSGGAAPLRVVIRGVDLEGAPEVMEQHSKFSSNGHGGSLACVLSPSRGDGQAVTT